MCLTRGLREVLDHFLRFRPDPNPSNPARARPAGPARSGTFSGFSQNLEFSEPNRAGSGATMALEAKLNKWSRCFIRDFARYGRLSSLSGHLIVESLTWGCELVRTTLSP